MSGATCRVWTPATAQEVEARCAQQRIRHAELLAAEEAWKAIKVEIRASCRKRNPLPWAADFPERRDRARNRLDWARSDYGLPKLKQAQY